MEQILERNSDHQVVEHWYDAIRFCAERIVNEERLPITAEALWNAVGVTEVSQRTNHHSERISNVMTALGYMQGQRRHQGGRPRGWWPSQATNPKI